MESAESLIPWRRRRDLIARPQGPVWVLKDPVAQRYFQLGGEAYFVWSLLNGSTTVGRVCQEFAERFAPRTLSTEELRRFLGQLAGQGLLWGDAAGAGASTERRRAAGSKIRQWSAATNILAIRLRGIDPDRALTYLTRTCGWMFAPWAIVAGAVLILSAIVLWLVRFEEFARRLPEEVAQWSVGDLMSFAVVLGGLKVLHELGHGISCKRAGGEVRELGVLFLVFTPCLYCNVSDAWLLPSRWQRMAISAAGMWVEMLIAAACVWLWWGSIPGWFHAFCLQIVFISGVSTLLFNMNPLLRYDGYFLLADLCGIANLQQRASQELSRRVRDAIGLASDPPAFDLTRTQRRWLAVYALFSFLYRCSMVVAILWVIDRWLEPQGLRLLSQGVTLLTLLTLAAGPLTTLRQGLRDSQSRRRWAIVNPVRMIAATAFLVLILTWPLPSRVHAPAVLMPADALGVYVTMEGRLVEIVPPGTALRAGDVIARLENPTLQRELARVQGEVDQARQTAETLQRRQILDPRAGLQLPAARKQLRDLEEQLQQRLADAERLTIRAPQVGILWEGTVQQADRRGDQLPNWSGSPFAERNRQCWLKAGTQLGWIGSADRSEARAFVPQADVSRLATGQTVSLAIGAARDHVVRGEIAEVSTARQNVIAPDLVQRLRLPEIADASGRRLVGTWYQLRIPVKGTDVPFLALETTDIAVHTPAESILTRSARWVRDTFVATR